MQYETDRRELEATDVYDVVYRYPVGDGGRYEAPASDIEPPEPPLTDEGFSDDEF